MLVSRVLREASSKFKLQTPYYLKGLPQNGRQRTNRTVQAGYLFMFLLLGVPFYQWHVHGTMSFVPSFLPALEGGYTPLSRQAHDVDAAVEAYKKSKKQ